MTINDIRIYPTYANVVWQENLAAQVAVQRDVAVQTQMQEQLRQKCLKKSLQ